MDHKFNKGLYQRRKVLDWTCLDQLAEKFSSLFEMGKQKGGNDPDVTLEYFKFLEQLEVYKFHMKGLSAFAESAKKNRDIILKEEKEFQVELVNLKNNLKETEKKLELARVNRKNKLEYSKISGNVLNYPDSESQKLKIEETKNSCENLKNEALNLIKRIQITTKKLDDYKQQVGYLKQVIDENEKIIKKK